MRQHLSSAIRVPVSVILYLSLVLRTGVAAAATDWPEFRGPDGQGHSTATNLPIQWSTSKNIAWKTPLPGLGWSSPVVSDGRIFLTTAVSGEAKNLSLRVLCLDAATGEILGNVEVFNRAVSYVHNKNSHASPTPLVEGERLYVHFGHQGTACLDLTARSSGATRN